MKRSISMTAVGLVGLLASFGASQQIALATSLGARHAPAFPVTVVAANGPVTFAARPTRIISLSATATQMLYGIGAGPQVVAVDKYSTDPANAPRTGLTGYESSAEDYVRFHPDLVVLAFDQNGLFKQLAILHIHALLMPPAQNLAETYSQFVQLGRATGHSYAANKEVASIRHQLATIVRAAGHQAKGLTYYQEIDPTLYTATSKTFIGALYARLGMVNIADAAGRLGIGYPQLSAEYLLKANPDFVFLADDQCCAVSAKSFALRPGYAQMRAVRLHHVFAIPDPIASEWGPRVVDFLRTVAHDLKKALSTQQ